MLDFLSTVHSKFGYSIELAPLAPGHAYNRTDARIAHMNTFMKNLKARTHVFGAQGVAKAFHAASESAKKKPRKHMARCHIFYRSVKVDNKDAKTKRKTLVP